MSGPTILVLGAGGNIGASLSKSFLSHGWNVALASRSRKTEVVSPTELSIELDLCQPKIVQEAFDQVKRKFGAPPAVVVYNAFSFHMLPSDDPLSKLQLIEFEKDLAVNTTSALMALQCAVAGFKELPSSNQTFFYTGAMINVLPWPGMLSLGIGKSASAHMIWEATVAYRGSGYKFYYMDERSKDSEPMWQGTSADAMAQNCWELVESKEQKPWMYTFIKDVGYHVFNEAEAQVFGAG